MRTMFQTLLPALALIVLAGPVIGQVHIQPSTSIPVMDRAGDLPFTMVTGGITFSQDPVRSADVKVDAQGGTHVAFVSLGQINAPAHKPVVYGYCPPGNPSACTTPAGWTLVEVGVAWQGVRLALTPQGFPRLFLYDDRATVEGVSATIYGFAGCDAGCTTASGWQLRTIGSSEDAGNIDSDRRPVRRFALDPQGRPRFVYYYGTVWTSPTQFEQPAYYIACDAHCATTGQWSIVRLPDLYLHQEVHDLENAALTFAPNGAPRLLWAQQYPYGDNEFDLRDVLVYAECELPCTSTAHWSPTLPLLFLGSGPEDKSFSAQVDSQGRFHAAVKPIDEPLLYVWCASNCLNIESWGASWLAMPTNDGEHPALILDGQNNPRIAFKDAAGGLGYAWCDQGCRTANPQWSRVLLESEDDLMGAVPISLLPGCIEHYWFGGLRPAIALDPAGSPRFAYDADYSRRCYINPQRPQDGTFIERVWWTSRFGFSGVPPVSTEPIAGPAGELAIAAIFPNPIRGSATISYEVSEPSLIRVSVIDVLGREVMVLEEGKDVPPGSHRSTLDTTPLAGGTYVIRLQAGDRAVTRRVTVIN